MLEFATSIKIRAPYYAKRKRRPKSLGFNQPCTGNVAY